MLFERTLVYAPLFYQMFIYQYSQINFYIPKFQSKFRVLLRVPKKYLHEAKQVQRPD